MAYQDQTPAHIRLDERNHVEKQQRADPGVRRWYGGIARDDVSPFSVESSA